MPTLTYRDLDDLGRAVNALSHDAAYLDDRVATLYPDNSETPATREQLLRAVDSITERAAAIRAAIADLPTEE